MSKIIVRRQEYANNGTHANEIEAVVKQNLIVNTLSSAMDVAPSVGLLKSISDEFDELGGLTLKTIESFRSNSLRLTPNVSIGKVPFLIFGTLNNVPAIIICSMYKNGIDAPWGSVNGTKMTEGATSSVACTISDNSLIVPVSAWGIYAVMSFVDFDVERV